MRQVRPVAAIGPDRHDVDRFVRGRFRVVTDDQVLAVRRPVVLVGDRDRRRDLDDPAAVDVRDEQGAVGPALETDLPTVRRTFGSGPPASVMNR